MLLRCLPSGFSLIQLTVWEEMSFKYFQDGRQRPSWISERNNFSSSESLCCSDASHHVFAQSDLRFGRRYRLKNFNGGHLEYRNETILAVLNLYVAPMPPIKFRLMVWEEMSFEEFQDGLCGGHLGYRNETILAILNLCVTVMLPIKFWLNPTDSLGGDVVWRFSRWPPWRRPWISDRNDFSKFESLCRSDASHQVSAQSDLWFGCWCSLKNFKMTTMAAILDIGTQRFDLFWISVSLWCLPSSFSSIQLTVWEEISYEKFQDGFHGDHLGYRNGTILAMLNLCVTDAFHQVLAQSNVRFVRTCRLKNFRMASVAAILDIGTKRF